jgi:hypothetical protein
MLHEYRFKFRHPMAKVVVICSKRESRIFFEALQ